MTSFPASIQEMQEQLRVLPKDEHRVFAKKVCNAFTAKYPLGSKDWGANSVLRYCFSLMPMEDLHPYMGTFAIRMQASEKIKLWLGGDKPMWPSACRMLRVRFDRTVWDHIWREGCPEFSMKGQLAASLFCQISDVGVEQRWRDQMIHCLDSTWFNFEEYRDWETLPVDQRRKIGYVISNLGHSSTYAAACKALNLPDVIEMYGWEEYLTQPQDVRKQTYYDFFTLKKDAALTSFEFEPVPSY
jgi:hypothetical protein